MSSDSESIVVFADAGGEIGFGHLMRCRELALQILEQTGRRSTFVVDDIDARRRILAVGLQAEWGALEREPRRSPEGHSAIDGRRLAADCAYAVLDLFGKRTLEPGWSARLGRPSVVIDRAEIWSREADLILIPGVTYPEDWQLPMMMNDSRTPIYGGRQFIILRAEIRERARASVVRDIDLLVYLYDEDQKRSLREFGSKHGLDVRIIEEATVDFPELLARSRLFLSGFGISFYEALALGTRPLAWPLSEQHALDAKRFFDALDLPPAIVNDSGELGLVLDLLKAPRTQLPAISDGTPRIVELLERTLVSADS